MTGVTLLLLKFPNDNDGDVVRLRFGEKVAAPDPSDTEAMKAFQAQGGVIVAGLSKGEWANVKRAGAVLPAGKICPTAKPYSADPNADPVNVIPPEKWTEGMKNIAAYAEFLGRELMGVTVTVAMHGPHDQQLRRLLRCRAAGLQPPAPGPQVVRAGGD